MTHEVSIRFLGIKPQMHLEHKRRVLAQRVEADLPPVPLHRPQLARS
jgi:hypothetical protein